MCILMNCVSLLVEHSRGKNERKPMKGRYIEAGEVAAYHATMDA